MPPLIFSPLIKFALGALGAGAISLGGERGAAHQRGARSGEEASSIDPAARQALPTLRRDPSTGDWRPT